MKKIDKWMNLIKKEELSVCIWGTGIAGTIICKQILDRLGIRIDYYCDNNHDLWNKAIIDGIYCRPYENLLNNKENTVCIVCVRCDYILEVCEQLESYGIERIITLDQLIAFDDTPHRIFPYMQENKIAVYTCIVKGYDKLEEPEIKYENCDYYLISDVKSDENSKYSWINIEDVLPNGNMNGSMQNRYCKMHPHKIFPEYKYSVYHDGSVRMKENMSIFIPQLKKARIGVAARNWWDCLYEEGMRVLINFENALPEEKKSLIEAIKNQIKKYWLQGMPEHYGSFVNNVLLREHNNPKCIEIMNTWWEEFQNAWRDQISFPYSLWRHGYTQEDILVMNENGWIDTKYWEAKHVHAKAKIQGYL